MGKLKSGVKKKKNREREKACPVNKVGDRLIMWLTAALQSKVSTLIAKSDSVEFDWYMWPMWIEFKLLSNNNCMPQSTNNN